MNQAVNTMNLNKMKPFLKMHQRTIILLILSLLLCLGCASMKPTDEEPAEELADKGLAGVGRWLHTLGYRGHITSKSRRYSTTMTALRERRAAWTREQRLKSTAHQHDLGLDSTDGDDLVAWEFDRAGPTSLGDRTLIYSAAVQHIHTRRIGLIEVRGQARNQQWDPPGGSDG